MSPEFMRGMSYFLPAISLIFTSFLPSAIQLSFFITGFLSYCQAQLFRWAPFRAYMNMTPLPTNRPDAFDSAPAAEPQPYQSRIITATARPTPSYEPPRSSPPAAAKPTLLSGLKREVSSGISSVQESARKTLKSAREMTGQESKDGKRTKRQLQQANEYERKRRLEEGRRREEVERERRARREANRE
jgi:YidC/Oxa1 family membrane protein insertase